MFLASVAKGSALWLKDCFCNNAMKIKKIDERTICILSAIIMVNIAYIVLISTHNMPKIGVMSQRQVNTVFSFFSCAAFLYALRGNLYKTFDVEAKDFCRSFVQMDIIYLISTAMFIGYTKLMRAISSPLGGDVQHIHQMARIPWDVYFSLFIRYVFSILNEELLILALFLIVYSLFKKYSVKFILLSLVITLVVFGCLHIFSWNWATVPAVMISKFSAIALFIFFLDVKPVYFAHLFNNSYVVLGIVNGMTVPIKHGVLYVFYAPLIIFLVGYPIWRLLQSKK